MPRCDPPEDLLGLRRCPTASLGSEEDPPLNLVARRRSMVLTKTQGSSSKTLYAEATAARRAGHAARPQMRRAAAASAWRHVIGWGAVEVRPVLAEKKCCWSTEAYRGAGSGGSSPRASSPHQACRQVLAALLGGGGILTGPERLLNGGLAHVRTNTRAVSNRSIRGCASLILLHRLLSTTNEP